VTAEANRSEILNRRLAREWTGYGAPRDKPAAAAKWTVLATYREDVPLSLRARAYSSLARGWLDLAVENGPALNINYLYDAGNNANEAIALGLISPAALMVASRIESAGFRRPEDNKFPEHSTERFERLTDLWEAFDARTAEIAEEGLKREAKVSKDPLGYFCAAEDCGIVATKKSTLRRCGGGCPRAFKPSYCSKYCQKAVRFLSYTPNDVVHSPCRIGNTTSRTADQTLQNRVFVRLVAQAQQLVGGDRTRRKIRDPRGSNQVQNGRLT